MCILVKKKSIFVDENFDCIDFVSIYFNISFSPKETDTSVKVKIESLYHCKL